MIRPMKKRPTAKQMREAFGALGRKLHQYDAAKAKRRARALLDNDAWYFGYKRAVKRIRRMAMFYGGAA